MAAGYDGSIRINTRINPKGFNDGTTQITNGLNRIIKSLKGVASAVGLAFGVKAILDFSRTSIKASTDLANALMGLQSIMEGQGRSFQQAQKFINEYISDGLIPATQAITAYKNLALRGYDDSQIQQVLIALKDSAAFGRQASYSLGEAVESATEGLKNENSILVDNAGVTKNVAKMWEDYAKSIGTTVNNLTHQQKIQAEVNGILEESKYQSGDAAKVANSFSGEMLKLGYRFNDLKIAIGNALIPIASAILPSINAMISGFTRLANVFAQVTTAMFGQQTKIATSGTSAAKAEKGLAKATKEVGDATKKTNKELKNTLANFDELNVLAQDTADNAGGIDEALVDAGGLDISGLDAKGELFGNVTVNPKLQKDIDKIKESLKEIEPYLGKVGEAGGRLVVSFGELWKALAPIREALSRIVTEMGLNLLTVGSLMLAGALDELSGVFLMIAGILTGDWNKALDGAKLALKGLGEIIEGWFIIILGKDAVEAIKVFLAEWSERIPRWFEDDVKPWFTKEKWLTLFQSIKSSFVAKWKEIELWWDGSILRWWNNRVAPWFTRAKWIEIMVGVKEGFAETFKNAVNAAIELFNKLIGWINEKMKFTWDEIKIAGKVIVPAGNVQLFNIPSIPKLATGAVIPPNNEFLAILGDQKSGRNIEAPEGLIRQIIQEELAAMGGTQTDIQIHFTGTMAQFVRMLKPEITREDRRKGTNLIVGGST